MTSVEKYRDLVISLKSKGVNFDLDVWNCNSGENYDVDWNELAAVYGYRRPKNAYFSKGRCFYMLLQRVYGKLKSDPSFLNSVAELVRMQTICGIK